METDANAKAYDEVSGPQIEVGSQFICDFNLSFGDKVLEMGCGTGHLTKYIADIVGPDGQAVGIDPDAERIKIAEEKYKEVRNLQFYVGSSVIGFPNDNEPYYDVHISTNVFHWVPDDEKRIYIQKAHQCLKAGGKLAIWCCAKFPNDVALTGFYSLTQEGYRDLFQEVATSLQQCCGRGSDLLMSIPQSLAWAVRKLSPGKNAAPSPPPVFAKNAVRTLEFESEGKTESNVISWADRVKGKKTISSESSVKAQTASIEVETVQSVVEQNGFVAIHEQNLKVEEDGEGWETVCYSKKNRTPEKCSSECSSESRDISHDYGGEPRVKGLVTVSGDLQPILKRVIPAEKDRSSVNEDNGSAADNCPAIVDSKPVTSGDDTLGNGVEALAGNVTCDADESVSPIIRQESIEDKELS
ncbi:Hypothetical predicted protein, partial [Paramuricea clavata]